MKQLFQSGHHSMLSIDRCLCILLGGFHRIFIWILFIWLGSRPPWDAGIITVSLSQMGYLRVRDIRKFAQDSTSCPLVTSTKKNLRRAKSSLEKWNSLPEVSQSVVQAGLKPRKTESTPYSLTTLLSTLHVGCLIQCLAHSKQSGNMHFLSLLATIPCGRDGRHI